MEETLYVIATAGRNNQEIYLKCKETANGMEWTNDIEESYADYDYGRIQDFANEYFKQFNKWYIKKWVAKF